MDSNEQRDTSGKKRKRKRKVYKPINALFLSWLEEWRDDAREKQLKTHYNYNKAMRALEAYPLPVKSGDDCRVLEGFGDKTCKMLSERLERHLRYLPDAANTSGAGSPKGSTKEYVPAPRSGGYGILLALLEHEQNGGKHMFKKELMRAAQPFCDASYTRPDPGSHYTAWASMGTLKKRGLVLWHSVPVYFHLTESGRDLAGRLWAATNAPPPGGAAIHSPPTAAPSATLTPPLPTAYPSTSSIDLSDDGLDQHIKENVFPVSRLPKTTSVHAISDSSDDELPDVSQLIGSPSRVHKKPERPTATMTETDTGSHTEEFEYWYIDSNDEKSILKDLAQVHMPTNEFDDVGYLIECKREALVHHAKKYCVKDYLDEDNVRALISEQDAKDVATTPTTATSSAAAADVTDLTDDVNYDTWEYDQAEPTALSPSPMGEVQITTNPHMDIAERCDALFTLYPDTFDIMLLVDNQESYGSGHGKEVLQRELTQLGVQYEVRKLNVGDFLWIARERGPPARELVLDHIVERKRMDDLSASIFDSRFKEQKFRMRHCGLRDPVYLVEDYGDLAHQRADEQRLLTAIVGTQVIDDFYVRHVRSTKESARFLAENTKFYARHYKDKLLEAVTFKDAGKRDKLDHQSATVQLLSFTTFSDNSIKSKDLTAKESFASILLCIARVSGPVAAAITDVYPTITHLMEAYDECRDDQARDKLLADLKYEGNKTKRRLGPALSKSLAFIFNTKVPFPS